MEGLFLTEFLRVLWTTDLFGLWFSFSCFSWVYCGFLVRVCMDDHILQKLGQVALGADDAICVPLDDEDICHGL